MGWEDNHKEDWQLEEKWNLGEKRKLERKRKLKEKRELEKKSKTSASKWIVFFSIISSVSLLLSLGLILCYPAKFQNGDDSLFQFFVGLIAVCATFIVGFQIYNTIEHRSQLRELESKITYKDDFTETTSEQIASLFKAEGDTSRMISVMLGAQHKPLWALGWMGRAIARYYMACEENCNVIDQESYMKITNNSCVPFIVKNIILYTDLVSDIQKDKSALSIEQNILKLAEKESLEKKDPKELLKRTFKDMIRYRILARKFDESDFPARFKEDEQQEALITNFLIHLKIFMSDDDLIDCGNMLKPTQEWKDLNKKEFYKEIEKYNFKSESGDSPIYETFCNLSISCTDRLRELTDDDVTKLIKKKNDEPFLQ